MIQFLLHILSVIIAAFAIGLILVWVQRKFSKQSDYRITCEYRSFFIPMVTIYSDEERKELNRKKWKELNSLGADGWQIACVADRTGGLELVLKRDKLHTS